MRKAFKYRLYPTKPQSRDLEEILTLCRHLSNAALQERVAAALNVLARARTEPAGMGTATTGP
ncbi:hypothetical protein FJNA_15330 [Thermus sp. FJN-A]